LSLAETPEEHMPVDDLVREADANRPDVEQALLNLKIDELTLKGVKNGLLPVSGPVQADNDAVSNELIVANTFD